MSILFSLGVRIVEAAAVVYATGVMFSRSALSASVLLSLSYSLASRVGSAGRTTLTRSAYQCQVQSEKPRDATWCSHEPPPPALSPVDDERILGLEHDTVPVRPSVQRGSQGVRQQQKGDLFFSHSSACHSLAHPPTQSGRRCCCLP